MDDKVLKDLLSKYRQGICTEEELALLENWVSVTTYSEYVISEKELQEDFDLIAKALPLVKPKETKLWPRIAVAAAIAAITLGTWIYMNEVASSRKAPRNDEVVMNDIAPGKNGATITLANGKVIQLSDSKTGVVIGDDSIKYNDGSFLSPSGRDGVAREGSGPVNPLSSQGGSLPEGERSEALTATTAKGQTYQFTLPDGTKVWLNADSKLEFPSNFVNSKTRFVKLSGEGYFEVAKDKAHPFVVQTDKQTVEVLGTHFNINSYNDESSVRTTLLEGSVSVRHAEFISASRNSKAALQGRGPDLRQDDDRFKQDSEAVILKPNQQSILTGSNRIKLQDVDVSEIVSWKDGEFKFKEETVESIMRKVARWYDVDVVYEKDAPRDIKLGGVVSRSRNVSAVLKMMELTYRVKFKIEGRKIVVEQVK
jgi:transmembrane sensor